MKLLSINLLAPEDRSLSLGLAVDAQQLDPVLIGVIASGLVAVLALPPLVTWAIDTLLVNPATSQSQDLAAQINRNNGAGRKVKELQAEVDARKQDLAELEGIVGQGGHWGSTLEELRNLTPTNLWLTELKAASDDVDLTGEALDYKDVAYFYTNLQNAHDFAAPVLGTISMSSVGSQAVVGFTLHATIVSPGAGS